MPVARVVSVDRTGDREGSDVWTVITDYAVKDADGLTRCAFWLAYRGPRPNVGDIVAFGARYVEWGAQRVRKASFNFDPADPALFTG